MSAARKTEAGGRMDAVTVTRADADRIRKEAARNAAEVIAAQVRELGANREQAVAISDAMRLALLGDYSAATRKMAAAGFPPELTTKMLDGIKTELKSAA